MKAVAKISVYKTQDKLALDTTRKAAEMHLSYAGVKRFVDEVDYVQVIKSDDAIGLRKGINGIVNDLAPGRKTLVEWS